MGADSPLNLPPHLLVEADLPLVAEDFPAGVDFQPHLAIGADFPGGAGYPSDEATAWVDELAVGDVGHGAHFPIEAELVDLVVPFLISPISLIFHFYGDLLLVSLISLKLLLKLFKFVKNFLSL